jgi:hypothetical protein
MGATVEIIDIEQLAWVVAEDGPKAHHTELAAVARSARASGVALVAADVLADRDAPAVARQRALGMVALDLAAFQAGQPLEAAVA